MPIYFDPSRLTDNMRGRIMEGVMKATELVRTEAVRLVVGTTKSGRMYGQHRASAPGQPWASNTGYALSTITASYNRNTLEGRVSINAEYGPMLELGTDKMEPRPVLRPALTNKAQEVEKIINDAIERALGGGR